MKTKTKTIVIVIGVAVLLAWRLLWAWAGGSFEHPPSASQKAAFESALRSKAAPAYGIPVTLERVDVVRGRYSRNGAFSDLLDWNGYQFAAQWRVNGTDARWVVLYRPGDAPLDPVDARSALDSDTVALVAAGDRATGTVMQGLPGGILEDPPFKVAAGSQVVEVGSYDATRGGEDFYGLFYYVVRSQDGSVRVVMDK